MMSPMIAAPLTPSESAFVTSLRAGGRLHVRGIWGMLGPT